jgi:hypothetical protein
MAIPSHLQQFKAAGIYRVVFDKSTITGVTTSTLRLVVGYSEKGPFNIPMYIKSASEFKSIYGDISKKLEKRGVYFHRLALQALQHSAILCLNLKKFDGETVTGATINTEFNPSETIIDTVNLKVEDIYDTTRFWELSADKLNGLEATDGSLMNQYINISATNTQETSKTIFIRKATGSKVSNYNITVSDWYSNGGEQKPEYLEGFENSLMSDFVAEIYVFNGKFNVPQVLASSTLKNYFEVTKKDEKQVLKLRQYVTNAYGDIIDTLDALYNDETSNPVAYYCGSLIPYFKNKQGQYAALDILFNTDIDKHNLMMSFNTDLLDSGDANIDLSGRKELTLDDVVALYTTGVKPLQKSLLGNDKANVVADVLAYSNTAVRLDDNDVLVAAKEFNVNSSANRITGVMYVSGVTEKEEDKVVGTETVKVKVQVPVLDENGQQVTETKPLLDENGDPLFEEDGVTPKTEEVPVTKEEEREETRNVTKAVKVYTITVKQIGAAHTVILKFEDADKFKAACKQLGITLDENGDLVNKVGTAWEVGEDDGTEPFIDDAKQFILDGPRQVITTINKLGTAVVADSNTYAPTNLTANVSDVILTSSATTVNGNENDNNVYESSVTFIPFELDKSTEAPGSLGWRGYTEEATGLYILETSRLYDTTLYTILHKGDCLLAASKGGKLDNVYVQDVISEGTKYVIKLTGQPYIHGEEEGTGKPSLVRVNNALVQEIGEMIGLELIGYTYKNDKPASTAMIDKLNWQKFILSALTDYTGLRTALLSKANIEYRYIVDTWESYVDTEVKAQLSLLAKEKQSAFAILNFPSVKTFIKCPYSAYTDEKGIFKVDYVVAGFNKKKPSAVKFELPTEANGASFCAFYTPLKFTDGYVDSIIPSAALVSNLFMEKYSSRKPYYIIAGPNYGNINAAGLVGPDYTYSQEELYLIEPFGVNCMVYRPSFGTFINANQTAKQTPVSALSKVNVRELVIYLQDEIEAVLQSYQWEFNNATTRAAILDRANNICANIMANGGLQAYKNVMDDSNNGPEIIDNEMAVLSTHIEPGMGCGKMVHELTIYRTGQMAAAIAD